MTKELVQRLKTAAQDEIMCRETCDTSDLWQDDASPENVLTVLASLEAKDQRIAELESRTGTVMLPPEVLRLAQAPQHLSKHDQLCWMSGANWMRMESVKLNPAVGVKVGG